MGIAWDASYATGVEAIDQQHQELFGRVSQLLEAMQAGRGRERVGEILGFLGEYVVEHFRLEEGLMARHAYPAAASHRAEHAELTATFAELRKRFEAEGPSPALAISLNNKIGGWLVRHVLATDKALGEFVARSRPVL